MIKIFHLPDEVIIHLVKVVNDYVLINVWIIIIIVAFLLKVMLIDVIFIEANYSV